MPKFPSEEGVGFLLNQASRSVMARLGEQFRQLGLDEHGWIVLSSAYDHQGNGCTPFDIAARLHVPSEVNITVASRLVRDGWLTTGDGGPVGESSSLCITQKTRDVMPGLEDTARWIIEHATNGFTARESDEFAAYLKRFNENLA
jgi:N6-adenosine-specific RNA methylase IME4